jgi:hypothetical protein
MTTQSNMDFFLAVIADQVFCARSLVVTLISTTKAFKAFGRDQVLLRLTLEILPSGIKGVLIPLVVAILPSRAISIKRIRVSIPHILPTIFT